MVSALSHGPVTRVAPAALGAAADGNHSCSDTRARNRTRFANVSLGTDDAQPGGDRPPPAPSGVKEGKHLMLARHRQSLILQAVRSDGSARVSDLTQRLGVSDMTIWRWDRDPKMAELGWPPPVKIRKRKFRPRKQLEAFKANLLRQAVETRAGDAA